MASALLMNSSTSLRVRAPFAGSQQLRRSANTARPRVAVTPMAIGGGKPGSRAEEARDKGSDDNPAEQAAKDFEKNIVEPFVKKTQENSGLNADVFNKTADSASNDEVGAFAEVQSFAGLAPEIVNGRGAMLGMLAAFGAELRTHEPVLKQVQTGPILVLGTFGLVVLASVIPIIRKADLSRKGFGPFTPRAEIWNGRLAMVAFASLILIEGWKAGPGLVP